MRHAIGVYDCLEDRAVGLKVREIHIAPGVEILMYAFADIEQSCLTMDTLYLKRMLDMTWSRLMLHGLSFEPSVRAIDAFHDKLMRSITGTVVLELYRATCRVIQRDYRHALDVGSAIQRGIEIGTDIAVGCIGRQAALMRAVCREVEE
jgi:argininosuccinate synthase